MIGKLERNWGKYTIGISKSLLKIHVFTNVPYQYNSPDLVLCLFFESLMTKSVAEIFLKSLSLFQEHQTSQVKMAGNPNNSPKIRFKFWKEFSFVRNILFPKRAISMRSLFFFFREKAEKSQLVQQPGTNLQDRLTFKTEFFILFPWSFGRTVQSHNKSSWNFVEGSSESRN